MSIPTDKDMRKFRSELEKLGASEVNRRLNQKIYGIGKWRCEEAKRFIEEEKDKIANRNSEDIVILAKEANDIAKESNKLAKRSNGIAWLAFIVSVIALVISVIKK